ncbi:hypothetical protein, partial [Pseudomonas paraeruginosa]|uniref:hypothetical protein n=1 Tax=Pseudomonas paraeruginosa TaxID=2994495 RepID=UPI0039FCF4EC
LLCKKLHSRFKATKDKAHSNPCTAFPEVIHKKVAQRLWVAGLSLELTRRYRTTTNGGGEKIPPFRTNRQGIDEGSSRYLRNSVPVMYRKFSRDMHVLARVCNGFALPSTTCAGDVLSMKVKDLIAQLSKLDPEVRLVGYSEDEDAREVGQHVRLFDIRAVTTRQWYPQSR